MKREIQCLKCGKPRGTSIEFTHSQEKLELLLGEYLGEGKKIIQGELTRSVLCDYCGVEMPKGTRAYAVSYYTDKHPYYGWEEEYFVSVERNLKFNIPMKYGEE